MFPVFLFLVVFSFYCWLAYESRLISDQQQRPEFTPPKTLVPVQSTVASGLHLDNLSKTSEAHLPIAPKPDLMLQIEQREAVPVALSTTQIEVPLDLAKKTLLGSEIAVVETTEEPAVNNNYVRKQVLEDIAALKIRSARKVASALGIRQKVNGADKSLNCLQQEIKQSLQNQPELVIQALELVKVHS